MTGPTGRIFRTGWRVFRLGASWYVWDPSEEFLARAPQEAIEAWDADALDGRPLREVFRGRA
jgi:hypothetical protein